jgi:FGGY-family pentulose kinase
MVAERLYLGIDVGTASVRAALFDASGAMRGMATHPIRIERPREDFVEQSSDDIWAAAGAVVRATLMKASATPEDVAGIGFAATCSLVALDAHDRPVTVSPTGDDTWNVIVWMDHRAAAFASRINETRHEVLRYVGGSVSPEMQTPKLLWLKESLPGTWRRATRLLDLPDFLVYRATGIDVRSLCTTVCKWTYLGHDGRGWQADFFEQIGLGGLAAEGFVRIGRRVRPLGERAGGLSAQSALELGLVAGTPVGVAIIDAHAGGIGMLGATVDGVPATPESLGSRLALIGGTSSCHMAVARTPRFVPGVWGPYFSAMIPGMWLAEGGQSATGALIDHVISTHARGAALEAAARGRGTTVYALLNERLEVLAAGAALPAALARDLHVLPDHHGNRSPRADSSLRGMVCGLKLTDSLDSLALLYLATVQAIAHGTRHIVDVLRAHGYPLDTLLVCGGGTKNELFLREHADATGCRLVLPAEPEAVLLGAAILGAVASEDRGSPAGDGPDARPCPGRGSLVDAMTAMTRAGRTVDPSRGDVARFHEAKHAVFLRMHEDQLAYRGLMNG